MNERDVIYVVAINDNDIHKSIEWLAECVRKRISKGELVSLDYLTRCSTMQKITLSAKRIEEKYGGRVTKAEREYGAKLLAERIYEMATEI